MIRNFDDQFKPFIRELLTTEYEANVFIWSVWHEGSEQFLYGISASNATGALWQDTDSGSAVPWIDSGTGQQVDWELS